MHGELGKLGPFFCGNYGDSSGTSGWLVFKVCWTVFQKMFVKCQDVSQDLAAHGVVMIFFHPFFFRCFLRLPTVQPVYPTPYTYPPPCWAPTKVWLRAFFAGCHRDALPDTCADLWCGTLACHPGCIWTRSVIPHIDDRCLENCRARGRESIAHYNIV